MSLIFFTTLEFSVDPNNKKKKKKEKMEEKVYGFLDHLICIVKGKFSLLQPEYTYLAVNVLTSSPKISDLIQNSFF